MIVNDRNAAAIAIDHHFGNFLKSGFCRTAFRTLGHNIFYLHKILLKII